MYLAFTQGIFVHRLDFIHVELSSRPSILNIRYCAAVNKRTPIFMRPAGSGTCRWSRFFPRFSANFLVPFGLDAILPTPLFRKITPRRSSRIAFSTCTGPTFSRFSCTVCLWPKNGKNQPLGLSLNFGPTGNSRRFCIFSDNFAAPLDLHFSEPRLGC